VLISLIVLLQAVVIGLLLRQHHLRRQSLLQAERQRLELAHASRLSMVGALSASIAHEINQPLSAIHMNASVGEELVKDGKASMAELKEILADIRRDDERASLVIKRLRQLLQKRPLEMTPIDINETLNEILPMLLITARHRKMSIRTDLGANLPPVRGDRVQVQQVVLNLVMNAIEASVDSAPERRVLTIRTIGKPEGWIEISVSDLGIGITKEELVKLFDPFYTTKREGMGLGLPISRSIVQSHGGRIWAQADPEGATFFFTLPVERTGEMGNNPTPPAQTPD
jgi:signal transduction histidine kinase